MAAAVPQGFELGGRIEVSAVQVKRLFFQVLQGLCHIHAYSVAHRDLKADNLLLDCSGQVKIADFGVARRVEPVKGLRLCVRVHALCYR